MPREESRLLLRVFGPGMSRITGIMREAAKQGCPDLGLLTRDGEYIICARPKAETAEQAQAEADRWRSWFSKELGAAIFAENQTELAEAAVRAMAEKHKLFVAADERTGTILNQRLSGLELVGSVYDFGQHSYADPACAKSIRTDSKLEKKYPNQPVQWAAGLARSARKQTEADWAVYYAPTQNGDPSYVLVCGAKRLYLRVLPVSKNPEQLAVAWMLDLLRRLALGLPMEPETVCFEYGKEVPPLLALISDEPVCSNSEEDLPISLREEAKELFNDSIPQKPEEIVHKTRWGRVLGCILLVGVVAAAVLFGSNYLKNQSGAPALMTIQKGYGTADYDVSADALLTRAQKGEQSVVAYLALPNLPGALVYGSESPKPADSMKVYADEDDLVRWDNRVKPGQPKTNLLLNCPAAAMKELNSLDQLEKLAENSGFTLYTPEGTYRYKTTAVFYWDPEETGEGAFDLRNMQDLSDESDYLDFVLGARARSLFDMPTDTREGDSFATLVTEAGNSSGCKLVITGRLLREQEAAILFGNQIESADGPLMPAESYPEGEQPSVEMLRQYWLNWYQTGAEKGSELQQQAGMPQEDRPLTESELPAEQTPEPTEVPLPSASPAPTPKPETTKAPESTQQPTPEPTSIPTAVPTSEPTAAPTAEPTAEPVPEPTETPSGKTITVTMNGVRQEMDLVECLAMIARNEMGTRAPMEAYKAQIVAAHSWILSQGGAPNVAGREPTETIRQAAREVADQVLTYGGTVAFTPYFASAAAGTNSSQDVWGSTRPYLVAVESPYDRDYASNWQNTRTYYKEEVRNRVQERLGLDLNAYNEDPAEWMGDLVKNSSGYVTGMRLGDRTITGSQLQNKILDNLNGKTLRSAAFDIVYDPQVEAFQITTYGYGHGCGLSQMGAWGYAAHGWGYADILAHYYPGTTLTTQ